MKTLDDYIYLDAFIKDPLRKNTAELASMPQEQAQIRR